MISDTEPTRFKYNQNKQEIEHSWLDYTFGKNIDPLHIKAHTIKQDYGSDHYPQIIDINKNTEYHAYLKQKENWKLQEDTNWKRYGIYIDNQWDKIKHKWDNDQREIQIASKIDKQAYAEAVFEDFIVGPTHVVMFTSVICLFVFCIWS
eukprot:464868_1